MTVVVLISHFRGMPIVTTDALMKFSTEIDIFINTTKTEFLNFSMLP